MIPPVVYACVLLCDLWHSCSFLLRGSCLVACCGKPQAPRPCVAVCVRAHRSVSLAIQLYVLEPTLMTNLYYTL